MLCALLGLTPLEGEPHDSPLDREGNRGTGRWQFPELRTGDAGTSEITSGRRWGCKYSGEKTEEATLSERHIRIPAPPLSSWVISAKLLYLSGPRRPRLQNQCDNCTYLIGFFVRINGIKNYKVLRRVLGTFSCKCEGPERSLAP